MRLSFNSLLTATALILSAPAAFAQLAPGPNPLTGTVTAAQTLTSGTGTIAAGGNLNVLGGGVAVTISGTSTLINNGTIQTDTGRALDSNTANLTLAVTNNGLISTVSADAFRVNKNSAVTLTNNGTIQVTNGGQAIDWAAITSKSNVLTNNATASSQRSVKMRFAPAPTAS